MNKRESGFSLIELMLVIGIMGFVLAAGAEMFVSMLRNYRQQSTLAETNIEGIIGLEMMRRDIESAGYGLPWQIPQTPVAIQYQEVPSTNLTAAAYNDAPANPPRALQCGNNITGNANIMSGSDYLVIKAVNLGRNDTCTKWTNLLTTGLTTSWGATTSDLDDSDRVIVMSPGAKDKTMRRILRGPTGGSPTITLLRKDGVSGFASPDETRLVYGVSPVDGTNPLRMPFNRADYYVSKTVALPSRCAEGTGVLVKALLNHGDGQFSPLPLLDCVADMQVVTRLDMSVPSDGQWETTSDGMVAANAQTVRDQLYEVHIYILAHEGQRDSGYSQSASTMLVGENISGTVYGRNFNFTSSGIANWQNYRWKVYTLIVKPLNVREANYEKAE